jgi:1,4-dihydroxy-6-naphthoate synthase
LKLTIGFSPCPNDTFIFDALIHHKIDTEGLEFDPVLEDVQTLNQWAIGGKLDITKLSYGVLPLVPGKYKLLDSGSALGKGVGPLLICKGDPQTKMVEETVIAIPGENTTAHLLFSLKYPGARNKLFLRYDAIEDFVLDGKGLGVIIHENRFTYAAKGLQKITDLGDYWEQQIGVPIPLGGIVIKSTFPAELQQKTERVIRKSIEYAWSKYPVLNDYIRNHAQEMSEDVMRKHIDLYVNDYSLSLGKEGKEAVIKLMDVYSKMNNKEINYDELFVKNA